MTNALTAYDPQTFETMQRISKAMMASGFFSDVNDIAQAYVKIQAGAELGIPPFAALTGINIQGGKPTLGANLIATLIDRHPSYSYRVRVLTDEECSIEFFQNGESVGVSSFTMKDAQTAKVWSKKQGGFIPLTQHNQNWQSYPRNMLFARAMTNGARWYAAAVFGGAPVYTPEEMGDENYLPEISDGVDDHSRPIHDASPTGITAVIQPWEVRSGPDNDELQGGNGYRPGDEIVRARKAAAAATEEGEYTEDDAQPVPGGPTYEDGTPVGPNVAEWDSFRDYVKAHDGKAPANVHNLRNWLKAQKKVAQPALVDEPANGAYQD